MTDSNLWYFFVQQATLSRLNRFKVTNSNHQILSTLDKLGGKFSLSSQFSWENCELNEMKEKMEMMRWRIRSFWQHMKHTRHVLQNVTKSWLPSGRRSTNLRSPHTLGLLFHLTIWTSSYNGKVWHNAVSKPWLSLGKPPNGWKQGVWCPFWFQATQS